MATLARLQARSGFIENQYYFRNSVVDELRNKEHYAAVKIQSWFRGCRVRAYIRYLNRVAIIIQKWWRGYLSRKVYRLTVEIQKRWRGYKVRKYCFNYFCFKEYLRAVSEANDTIREVLQEFAEIQESEEKKAELERKEQKREMEARKMHYLLSTKQISGIYNSPFRREPDPRELQLRKAKPLAPQRRRVMQKPSVGLTDWLACTSARSFPRSDILPPINRKPCQGPFRNINEVLEQRYKPLEPTLRATHSVDGLQQARKELRKQEWVHNISDKMFLPFSSHHKKEEYIPSVFSTSKYDPSSCRKQDFRSENPQKWICDKDFQTVFSSFDLFSKYGKSYSKAGEIV
ncbi:spermatogenesis-associated protein 17 isoform X2 [Cavia porcellus]|uniref:spermatogenesis-associated protein 17 isoform X2 n=1 Tax=Cavia porcellus TaxID=10141 RepID=UPI000C879E82|nr:spermatogenesis-associated protein 17 isoform X2 [Cavia porcellus]